MSGAPVAKQPYIGLDFFRGIAALAVVLYHVRAISLPAYGELADGDRSLALKAFYAASNFGHEAVLVFFVLSGYLVFGPVLARARRFDVTRYAIDRSSRILLPLIPAVLLMAAAAALWGEPITAGAVIAHSVGLNMILVDTSVFNAPLWTIAYEIWFYIFGAAIGLLTLNRRSVPGLTILAVVAAAFLALNPLYLLFWIAGGLMAVLPVKRPGLLSIVGAALLIGGTLLYEMAEAPGGPAWLPPSWSGECLVALGMALCLPGLVHPRFQRLVRPLGGVAIGLSAFSYSLYLFHYPVMKLTELVVPPGHGALGLDIVDLCVRVVVCIAASLLLYFAFEARTGRFRRFLAGLVPGADAPSAAPILPARDPVRDPLPLGRRPADTEPGCELIQAVSPGIACAGISSRGARPFLAPHGAP